MPEVAPNAEYAGGCSTTISDGASLWYCGKTPALPIADTDTWLDGMPMCDEHRRLFGVSLNGSTVAP